MRHFIFGGMAHNAQGEVGDKKGETAQLGRKRSKVGCILGSLGLNFLPATHYFSLFSAQVALGAGLTFRQTPVPALFLVFCLPKKEKTRQAGRLRRAVRGTTENRATPPGHPNKKAMERLVRSMAL